MYYQHIINKMKKLTIQFDWKNNEKWNLFLQMLNKNGYFPSTISNEIEDYEFLIKQAKKENIDSCCSDYLLIQNILTDYNDNIKIDSRDNNNDKSDSEEWLYMTENDLDKVLEMKMTNLKPTDLDDDDDDDEEEESEESDDDVKTPEEAHIKLKELTKELKKILQQSSEYDGVNLNEESEDIDNIPLPPSDVENEMDKELNSISDHSDIYNDSNAKDFNMIENLLKSMEAQDGMSGPASNLLSMIYEDMEKKKKTSKKSK